MPQLDVASFSSQLFWLGITFFGLYFLLISTYLPRTRRAIRLREAVLSASNQADDESEGAKGVDLLEKREALVSEFLSHCRSSANLGLSESVAAEQNVLATVSSSTLESSGRSVSRCLGEQRGKVQVVAKAVFSALDSVVVLADVNINQKFFGKCKDLCFYSFCGE
jgi:hypothetical protein